MNRDEIRVAHAGASLIVARMIGQRPVGVRRTTRPLGALAFAGRKHERRLTVSITRVNIGAARQQELKLIDSLAAYGVFPLTCHAGCPPYLGLRSLREHDSRGMPIFDRTLAFERWRDGVSITARRPEDGVRNPR